MAKKKITNRITLEDLASMVERTIAHKEDTDRIIDITSNILLKVAQLPTRVDIEHLLQLDKRVADLERDLAAVRSK